MIKTENITINKRELVKTYSDSGYMIKQTDTGNIYSEAIDPINHIHVYEETAELIPEKEFIAEEALNIITGGIV